jgi:hypothetical protein
MKVFQKSLGVEDGSHAGFCSVSLCEGDLLIGKRTKRSGKFLIPSPGCAVVKSFFPEQHTCKIFWFTGPSSGKTENLSLRSIPDFFDILPSGDQ